MTPSPINQKPIETKKHVPVFKIIYQYDKGNRKEPIWF